MDPSPRHSPPYHLPPVTGEPDDAGVALIHDLLVHGHAALAYDLLESGCLLSSWLTPVDRAAGLASVRRALRQFHLRRID